MTKGEKSQATKKRLSGGQTLFCVMSAVAMLITFKLSDVAIEAMTEGMRLCVNTVIPSLFPFMVFSELFIASGAAQAVGRYLAAPLTWLFDISREGAAALLLGLLCGFPIGSRSALSLYERGRISRGELEHILAFCNNPSSAFLISAVGVSLFGSRQLGVLFYSVHIISAFFVGLVSRPYFSKKKKEREYCLAQKGIAHRREGFIASLTAAVGNSAGSMILICAFVVFFSAVVGYLRFFAVRGNMPEWAMALTFGFFEMTGGVSKAAELPLRVAVPMAAALTGWSGLSVAFQFVGLCKEHRVSLLPYFFSKIGSALMNALLVWGFMRLFGERIVFGDGGSVSSLLLFSGSHVGLLSVAFFIGGCVLLVGEIRKKR